MKILLPQFALNTLSLIFNIVPRFILVGFCEAVTFLWFYVIRFRKKLVLDNMRQALGKGLSEPEIQKLAYRNLRHYVYFAVEYVQLTYMSARRFNKQMSLKNTEIVLEAL